MINEIKTEEIDNQDLQKEVETEEIAVTEESTDEIDYGSIAQEDIASTPSGTVNSSPAFIGV